MFRSPLCPSSGEQDRVLPHMVLCTGCAGCGRLWLWGALCTECTQFTTQLHTTTANHNHHNQCTAPYAVIHGVILLMMGIMVTETCWDRSLIINIGLVASCWFLSLHPTFMMHGHKNLKHLNKFSLCLSIRLLYRMKQHAFHGMIFVKSSVLDSFLKSVSTVWIW